MYIVVKNHKNNLIALDANGNWTKDLKLAADLPDLQTSRDLLHGRPGGIILKKNLPKVLKRLMLS